MEKNNGSIVINVTEAGDYYFNIVAENDTIVASSTIYKSENDLLKGISIIQDIFSLEDLNIIRLKTNVE